MKKPNEIKDYEIRKVFTDRNEPISEFQRWYKRANDNQDDFFVLSFYGKGGIGKSSLINQLCRDLAGKSGFFVKYDIEYTKGLDQYNILLGIKQSIRNRYGDLFHFPLYNFALIILAKKTDVIFKNDEVIKSIVEESPHLQIVLNTISLIPLVGGFIQNVSEIYAMICADIDNLKIHMTLKEKYKRYIDEMLKLEGDELRKKMPVYFAADMSENTEKLQKPFVIFIDTYEKYIDTYQDPSNVVLDSWLREGSHSVIQRIPGILWVISGREELTWEKDGEWDDYHLGKYEIEDFLPLDSREYLWNAGIKENALITHIHNLTCGVPVYLDLCVDTYYLLLERGIEPVVENFEVDQRKIVNCYIKYLDNANKDLVYMLAAMGTWIDDEAKYVGEKLPSITFSFERYHAMTQHSFIKESINGKKGMHDVVVEAILSEMDETTVNDVNKVLFHYRVTKLDGEIGSYSDTISLVNDTARSFCKITGEDIYAEQFTDFYKLLENIISISEKGFIHEGVRIGSLLNDHCEEVLKGTKYYAHTLYIKGFTLWKAGEYKLALSYAMESYSMMYELFGEEDSATLKSQTCIVYIYRSMKDFNKALDENIKVFEIQKRKSGLENIDTLVSFNTLGTLYGETGRYQEALEIFQKAYEIREELLGKDDPDTLKCLNNIGVTYTKMARYDEASKVLLKTYDIMKRVIGEEHPYTISVLRNMGENYKKMGNDKVAYRLLRKAYEGFEKVLGEGHPDTQYVSNLIAEFHHDVEVR